MALNPIASLLSTLMSLQEQQRSGDLQREKFDWTRDESQRAREMELERMQLMDALERERLGMQERTHQSALDSQSQLQQDQLHHATGSRAVDHANAQHLRLVESTLNQLNDPGPRQRFEERRRRNEPSTTELLSLMGPRGRLYSEGLLQDRLTGNVNTGGFMGAVDTGQFGIGRQ